MSEQLRERLGLRSAPVPRGERLREEPVQPRLQHRYLTLLFPILSIILVLLGSGGVLAEIFHTGLVFDQGYADYLRAADKASGEGLGLLHARAAGAIGERRGKIAAARNAAESVRILAQTDADVINTETAFGAQPVITQEKAMRYRLEIVRLNRINKLRRVFFATQETLRNELKNPVYSIKVGWIANDREGIPRQRLFPVPWSDQQSLQLVVFGCVLFPGYNDAECREEADTRIKQPEQALIGTPGVSLPIDVKVSAADLIRLNTYAVALADWERVVFYNSLDLERWKGANPGHSGETLRAVNAELGRVRQGLSSIRNRLQLSRELHAALSTTGEEELRGELINEMSAFLASDLTSAKRSPAEVVRAWLTKAMPTLAQTAHHERSKETEVRASAFYRSLRPLLANVWECAERGEMRLDVGRQFLAMPLWAVVTGVGTVVLVLGLFVRGSGRRLTMWRCALVAVPLSLIALLFPVRIAFNVNSATKNHADSIAADIVTHVVQGPYTARASRLQAQIQSDAADRASAIESQAKAQAGITKNLALQRKEQVLKGLMTLGSQELSVVGHAEQVSYWIESLPSRPPVLAQALRTLHYGAKTIERERVISDPGPMRLPGTAAEEAWRRR